MPGGEAPQNSCPHGKIEEITECTLVAADRSDIFLKTACGAGVRGRRPGQPRWLTVTGPLGKLQLAHALAHAAIARHLADPQPMQTDLTKKYEGKGDQLAQVLANAKQMTHPPRKVTRYEDSEMSTKKTLTQEQERGQKLKQTWEEEHKPKKIKKNHLYGTLPCNMPYRTVRAVVLYTVFYSVYYML